MGTETKGTESLQQLSDKKQQESVQQKKTSVLQAYQNVMKTKQNIPVEQRLQRIELPTDQVNISASTIAASSMTKAQPGQKGQQSSRGQTAKQKMASAVAIKQLVAKSAEMYFNIDNQLTFNFVSSEVEKLMSRLIGELGVKTEKAMDAKLEGKNLSRAKIFESISVMIAVESLIGGGPRNKKARGKYQAKLQELKTKMELLGYTIDDEHMTDSALEQGENFMGILKDMQRDISNRLESISQFEKLSGSGKVI
ncbi:MAG: hypothetical protein WC838_01325 [Candidatus Margulisiibacteriota bacterium]|jgi:hypothetical protein